MTAQTTVTMPERIARLDRDARGYPIPFVVLRDINGQPQFTANDARTVARAARERLCHICGEALDGESWFTGGPGSALLNGDSAGVYADGPMHRECMRYALQVCPYLAHRMQTFIGEKVATHLRERGGLVQEVTMIPGTPALFMCVESDWNIYAQGISLRFVVSRPFRHTEYWRDGALLPYDKGRHLAEHAARDLSKRLVQ